jgi:hypothetical protein
MLGNGQLIFALEVDENMKQDANTQIASTSNITKSLCSALKGVFVFVFVFASALPQRRALLTLSSLIMHRVKDYFSCSHSNLISTIISKKNVVICTLHQILWVIRMR